MQAVGLHNQNNVLIVKHKANAAENVRLVKLDGNLSYQMRTIMCKMTRPSFNFEIPIYS